MSAALTNQIGGNDEANNSNGGVAVTPEEQKVSAMRGDDEFFRLAKGVQTPNYPVGKLCGMATTSESQ